MKNNLWKYALIFGVGAIIITTYLKSKKEKREEDNENSTTGSTTGKIATGNQKAVINDPRLVSKKGII